MSAIKRVPVRADTSGNPSAEEASVPQWMGLLIVVMLVVDVAVLVLILRRRGKPALGQAVVDFARIHQLTRAAEERMVGHFEASYGGNPDQLPEALRGAVEIARQIAREQLVPLDEDGLRLVVTATVTAHKFASRAEVAKAFANLGPSSVAA